MKLKFISKMFLIFSKTCHNYICFVTENFIANFKIYE